jgi:hypothetical protein
MCSVTIAHCVMKPYDPPQTFPGHDQRRPRRWRSRPTCEMIKLLRAERLPCTLHWIERLCACRPPKPQGKGACRLTWLSGTRQQSPRCTAAARDCALPYVCNTVVVSSMSRS